MCDMFIAKSQWLDSSSSILFADYGQNESKEQDTILMVELFSQGTELCMIE